MPLERSRALSTKSSEPSRAKLVSSLRLIATLIGRRCREMRAFAREGQIVGFAHVEVEIDGIERDERRQQGRRAGGGPAAGDQAADRDQARADAAREGGGDVAIFEVELGVADLGLGVVDGGLGGGLLVHALVDGLGGSEIALLQRLGANELAGGKGKARGRGLELGGRLGELDLIGARIDDEKEIALVDDLSVLEMDLGERAADLRPQLDAIDRGELAEEADPRVDIAQQRLAHRDGRKRHGGRGSDGAAIAIGDAIPGGGCDRYHGQAQDPGPQLGSGGSGVLSGVGVRPIGDFVHVDAPLMLKGPFAVVKRTPPRPVTPAASAPPVLTRRRRKSDESRHLSLGIDDNRHINRQGAPCGDSSD